MLATAQSLIAKHFASKRMLSNGLLFAVSHWPTLAATRNSLGNSERQSMLATAKFHPQNLFRMRPAPGTCMTVDEASGPDVRMERLCRYQEPTV